MPQNSFASSRGIIEGLATVLPGLARIIKTNPMPNRKWLAPNKNELIIEVWESLDCESVGATELESIQSALRERFGNGAVESPAWIARLLAEEGASLRHPEVLECDSKWRAQDLAESPVNLSFNSLNETIDSLRRLEAWRKKAKETNPAAVARVSDEFLADVSAELSFIARSQSSTPDKQAEAREIAAWLKVWKQTPDLFQDWLDLRLESPAFRRLFPDFRPNQNQASGELLSLEEKKQSCE